MMDVPACLALRTPESTHAFAPSTIHFKSTHHMPTPDPLDNTAFGKVPYGHNALLQSIAIDIKEHFNGAKEKHVTVWATIRMAFRDELRDGSFTPEACDYQWEFVLILSLDDKREKIQRSIEFLDSKRAEMFGKLAARAKENLERLEKEGEDA